ncbi:hypothetical protein D3C85_1758830 [compost metagenome]
MIHFELVSGKPTLRTFINEIKALPFYNKLIVTSAKKIDFTLYQASQGDRSISLSPEFNLKF